MKLTIRADGFEGWAERGRERAERLSRKEMLEPEMTINFESPLEMLECLTAERMRLFKAAQGKVYSVSELAAALKRYASLFNAHDWEGIRLLLADDVRLDLVSRRKAAGRRAVSTYFSNYERAAGWHVVPARFDGREVLAVLPDPHAARPRYFIELGWFGERVVAIRDFRYVPYIAQEGAFEFEA